MSRLNYAIKKIICDEVHSFKCKLGDSLPKECWQKLDSSQIASNCLNKVRELLEAWLYLPCCHVSGMHDHNHFKNRKICNDQMARAYERFCKDLEVDPVVKSEIGCAWCRDYPEYRVGEDVKLSKKQELI